MELPRQAAHRGGPCRVADYAAEGGADAHSNGTGDRVTLGITLLVATIGLWLVVMNRRTPLPPGVSSVLSDAALILAFVPYAVVGAVPPGQRSDRDPDSADDRRPRTTTPRRLATDSARIDPKRDHRMATSSSNITSSVRVGGRGS
jgi:hypothetical protein